MISSQFTLYIKFWKLTCIEIFNAMFQLPAYTSLVLDICLVLVYFNDPTALGDDQSDPFKNRWDPLRSYLLLSVFAGIGGNIYILIYVYCVSVSVYLI